MGTSQILKIATVEVPVTDLERSITWFSEMLGFQVNWKGADAAMLALPDPANTPTLYLVRTKTEERLKFLNTNTGVKHSVIDFYTNDLAAFHAALTQKGATITGLKPGARGFGMKDPDGNLFGVTDIGQ